MILTAYLYIDTKGSMEIKRRKSNPHPSQIALELNIDMPVEFFERPIPEINIALPASYLVDPDIKTVAHFASLDIADSLKLDAKLVEDGLLNLLKNKTEGQS